MRRTKETNKINRLRTVRYSLNPSSLSQRPIRVCIFMPPQSSRNDSALLPSRLALVSFSFTSAFLTPYNPNQRLPTQHSTILRRPRNRRQTISGCAFASPPCECICALCFGSLLCALLVHGRVSLRCGGGGRWQTQWGGPAQTQWPSPISIDHSVYRCCCRRLCATPGCCACCVALHCAGRARRCRTVTAGASAALTGSAHSLT
jgi:hypothetical protein